MATAWRFLQQAKGREASSVDLTEATGSQAEDDGKQGKRVGLANTRINRQQRQKSHLWGSFNFTSSPSRDPQAGGGAR